MKRRTENIPLSKIKPGKIKHGGFSEELLQRMRAVHDRIRGVYAITLEQWELGFMRDAHPEKELAIWERMADLLDEAARRLPTMDRKAIFKVVLGHSMGALTPQQLADPDVQKAVKVCEGK